MASAEERAWSHAIFVQITLLGLLGRAVVATTFDTDRNATGCEGSYFCEVRSVVVDTLPVR